MAFQSTRTSETSVRKGRHGMNTMYPNQTAAPMATSYSEEELQDQHQPGNFLYQAATILAILLFLISF
jgi:hypothetical protein